MESKNLDSVTVPKSKLERWKKLENAKKVLVEEFVGLEDIISKIILAITPWYITPEVIKRPVVVSLWGMTGTGKTSVIRRLVGLLGLDNKTLFFDCGAESNDSSSRDVGEKIFDAIQSEDEDHKKSSQDMVFVFDEFQYARTLDEQGCEINKANLRPVWNMMDSGILSMTDSSYEIGRFCDFVEDLESFVKEEGTGGIELEKGEVINPDSVKLVLETLGYFYFDRGIPGLMDPCCKYGYEDSCDTDDPKQDPYRPLRIIDGSQIRTVIRKADVPPKTAISELYSIKTLGELVDYLEEKRKIITTPKTLDVTKSLIFVVGNLDEAFHVEGDINPDLDADVFYDETSKVTVSDIKEALKSRFRAEQIARFGNSLIKYPTLKEEHFKKIIEKEVDRICAEFKKENGISVVASQAMRDLLYSEGVYPVQGVRPVFTTIGTILTPLLSNILIYTGAHDLPDSAKEWEVIISPEDENFKVPKKTVYLNYISNGGIEEIEISMPLGELRAPENRKTRFINSVHETGHAILMTYLTGKLPTSIVSVSTDKGGFCTTYDPDKTGEIKTRRDIANDVMIGLGGWLAEKLVFGHKEDMTLLGSGSDIRANWESLSHAAYHLGYFAPNAYCNLEALAGDGTPEGLESQEVDKMIKKEFRRLQNEATKILKENKNLLLQTALKLGDSGDMTGVNFLEYIKTFGKTLCEKRISQAIEENDPSWYEKEIINQINN